MKWKFGFIKVKSFISNAYFNLVMISLLLEVAVCKYVNLPQWKSNLQRDIYIDENIK